MGTSARKSNTGTDRSVPKPAVPVPEQDLPRVLSFALCASDRADVLAVLRGYGSDRSAALLAALGLGDGAPRGGNRRGG